MKIIIYTTTLVPHYFAILLIDSFILIRELASRNPILPVRNKLIFCDTWTCAGVECSASSGVGTSMTMGGLDSGSNANLDVVEGFPTTSCKVTTYW